MSLTYSTQFFMGNRQNVSGSGKEMGTAFVSFERNNVDQIRSKVNDELWILNFFEVRLCGCLFKSSVALQLALLPHIALYLLILVFFLAVVHRANPVAVQLAG